jgi:hypothetical protein
MWTAIPQGGRGCRKTDRTRKLAGGKKRRHTIIKCDALLDEQEGRLVYMRDTYKLCPGLYNRGDGGDLGERRAGERVIVAQDAQDK